MVRAVAELGARLPGNWRTGLGLEPLAGDKRADALLEVYAPDGTRGALVLEEKGRLDHCRSMIPESAPFHYSPTASIMR